MGAVGVIHLLLAACVGVLAVVAVCGGALGLRKGSALSPWAVRAGGLVFVSVLLSALAGLVLLLGRQGPRDGLHYLYAAVALAVVPAWRLLGGRLPRRAALYQVAGGLLLLGVLARLYFTGL